MKGGGVSLKCGAIFINYSVPELRLINHLRCGHVTFGLRQLCSIDGLPINI
jgi:hypothetical protein